MSKGEYIKDHLFWSVISYVWAKHLFFRCIGPFTYMQSHIIVLLLAIAVIGTGISFTLKKARNYYHLISNITITWGIYIIIAYIDLFRKRFLSIYILALFFSVIMLLVIFCRKIEQPSDIKRRIIAKRLKNALKLCRLNLFLASIMLLLPLIVSSFLHGTVMNSKVAPTAVYGDEHGLEANIEIISHLTPRKWEELTTQQKLDVCQTVVNCECRYLGISHEVSIGTAALPEDTLGYYNDHSQQIVIDIHHLTDSYSYDILVTILHECTHVYQHEQVTLYQSLDERYRNLQLFKNVSEYAKDFADYEDGSNNYYDYYTQQAEVDAREAGTVGALEYISAINQYYLDKIE